MIGEIQSIVESFPPSRITRAAKALAASTKVGSLSRTRAALGVLERALRRTLFPAGCVHGFHHGVEEHALPVNINAASPLAVISVGLIGPRREVEVPVVVDGLVGFDAVPAKRGRFDGRVVQDEKSAHSESVVSHDFSRKPIAGLSGNELIVGIELRQFFACDGRLPVGRTGDEKANQGFNIPVVS